MSAADDDAAAAAGGAGCGAAAGDLASVPAPAARRKRWRKAITRKKKLWAAGEKRLVLTGVKCGPDIEIARGEDLNAALAHFWIDTFTEKPHDENAINRFLDSYAKPLDLNGAVAPTTESFRRIVHRLPASAPGPDGIPFKAWSAGGEAAIETLWLVHIWAAEGLPLPLEGLCSLLVFLPKGEEASDGESVVRAPGDTRPISLKSSDLKIIGSVVSGAIRPCLIKSTRKAQRWFAPTGDFTTNIIDLDAHARARDMFSMYAKITAICLLPCLVFFYIAAAFPFLCQFFMWMVLKKEDAQPACSISSSPITISHRPAPTGGLLSCIYSSCRPECYRVAS